MKILILTLALGGVFSAQAYANDKGNTFDGYIQLSPMGQMLGYELRVGIYTPLCSKEIVRGADGALLVSGLGILAGEGEGFIPLREIVAAKPTEINVGVMSVFIDFVAGALKDNKVAIIDGLVSDKAFYASFGTRDLKASFEKVRLTPNERKTAHRMLDTVTLNFWKTVKREITKEAGADGWSSFLERIDETQLGYSLPK